MKFIGNNSFMQLLASCRKNPFLRILIFYITGLYLSSAIQFDRQEIIVIGTAMLFILVALILYLSFFKNLYRTGLLAGIGMALLLIVAGILNMSLFNEESARRRNTADEEILCFMQIIDTPEETQNSMRCRMRTLSCQKNGEWVKERRKIMAYFQKDSSVFDLTTGDILISRITLSSIDPPANPGEFDYQSYLSARGINNQTYIKSQSWQVVDHRNFFSVKVFAGHLRESLLKKFEDIGLDKTEFSILSAITLGYRNDLSTHTRQMFSQAGVIHIMALSGFNVGLIALVLGFIFRVFGGTLYGRILKTTFIIILIWFYAVITGLSPSVTRASVMITFVLTGKLLRKKVNTINILCASAFFMLVFSPSMIYDTSFQLSFSAVGGIVMLFPFFSNLVVIRNKFLERIWNLFSVSCAAQLSTLPLTLYYFHQFPVYFWLTNIYVVPLVSLIIIVTLLFFIFSWFHSLALVIGRVLAFMVGTLYKSVCFVEVFPYSLIDNVHINILQMIILLLVMLCAGISYHFRKRKYLFAGLILLLLFQITGLPDLFRNSRQKIIMIGNVRNSSFLNFFIGNQSLLISDSSINISNSDIRYHFQNFWIRKGVADNISSVAFKDTMAILHEGELGIKADRLSEKRESMIYSVNGYRMVYLLDKLPDNYHTYKKFRSDIVVCTDKTGNNINGIIRLFDFDILVIDPSVKYFQAEQIKEACAISGIKYWDVSEEGAYLKIIQ